MLNANLGPSYLLYHRTLEIEQHSLISDICDRYYVNIGSQDVFDAFLQTDSSNYRQ